MQNIKHTLTSCVYISNVISISILKIIFFKRPWYLLLKLDLSLFKNLRIIDYWKQKKTLLEDITYTFYILQKKE